MSSLNPEHSTPQPIVRPVESDPLKVTLEDASDIIRDLVKDKLVGSAIGSRTTELEDGSTISVFYRPDTDTVGVAEIKSSGESRKIRDRKWSNQDVSNPQRQERQVVRRDGRGKMELKKFGFRERDVKRIGRLVAKFKENEGIDG